jgi:DNA-directed RNA polymerase subunit K/omega
MATTYNKNNKEIVLGGEEIKLISEEIGIVEDNSDEDNSDDEDSDDEDSDDEDSDDEDDDDDDDDDDDSDDEEEDDYDYRKEAGEKPRAKPTKKKVLHKVNNNKAQIINTDDDSDDDEEEEEDEDEDEDDAEDADSEEEEEEEVIDKYTRNVLDNYKKMGIRIVEPENLNLREIVTTMVKPINRTTSERLSLFEYARVLGERARHIDNGAMPYIDTVNMSSSEEIAYNEIIQKRLPMAVLRRMGSGMVELWEVKDMIIPQANVSHRSS